MQNSDFPDLFSNLDLGSNQEQQSYQLNEQQTAANSTQARSSPFQSGPVASINQGGFRPHVIAPHNDLSLNRPVSIGSTGSTSNSMQQTPPPQYSQDTLFPSPNVKPPTATSAAGLFSAETLFGSASTGGAYTPGRLNPSPSSMNTTSASNNGPPYRSSNSFTSSSYDMPPEQSNFGDIPPPAAPYLGYSSNRQSMNQSPSQSNSHSNPTSRSSSPAPSRQASQSWPSSPRTVPTPMSAHLGTVDQLVDEFLRGKDSVVDSIESAAGPFNKRFNEPYQLPAKSIHFTSLPSTLDTLELLYRQRRWKSLTKKALSMLQVKPTISGELVSEADVVKRTLDIKAWWLTGLIKEGHFDTATSVFDQIGNLDANQYTITIESGTASIVPMRLRVLEPLLCKYKGNGKTFELKMFQLVHHLKNILQQKSAEDNQFSPMSIGLQTYEQVGNWLRIIQYALVNHFIEQHKFVIALRLCNDINQSSSGLPSDKLVIENHIIWLSRVGRIYLQMGNLSKAEHYFNEARNVYETNPDDPPSHLNTRLLLNDGLLYFAQNQYHKAQRAFESVVDIEAEPNIHLKEFDFLEEDVILQAVNNYAIVALYCCDVKSAVKSLERMIRWNPIRFLNAAVAFNLSSLYDLLYDNATSTKRKEMMAKVAALYELENVELKSFRIS